MNAPRCRVVAVTGAGGFIGRNLMVRLGADTRYDALPITRTTPPAERAAILARADAVIHLAGVNRPADERDFAVDNTIATEQLCADLAQGGKARPVLFASSARAGEDTAYGRSKRDAEAALYAYARSTGSVATVLRLPNVFGKWARPNYNSAVATFCHNIAHGLPITLHDPAAPLSLVYIDDAAEHMLDWLAAPPATSGMQAVAPVYATTVGEVAAAIQGFHANRASGQLPPVGKGLLRALYATYVSYLPEAAFSYPLKQHADARGWFSEFLKTDASGQISVFTAHPGVTRGGHYHHTKTEKFLVLAGEALFRFRHVTSGERHEIRTSGATPVVVETVPGWTHDITNTGATELVCVLWANEVFDPAKPDTIAEKL